MAWFNKASDADLVQSMELAAAAAEEARQNGDKQREAAFHEDLNGMIDESERRGFPRWGR
ncbi:MULTISPECIES: hypothetical protein [Streptomyces]|uniref:hypothetical protein n=1 Tax=Streptomyces TaxID=1883 RepID=UPI00265B6112|nr:hypothetical protein [Streptomyces arenae]MCG7204138.1 hypothetical protein [Streptomyces arenae]